MAKQVSEFVSEFLDLPAQQPSWAQCVQNIDVAIRPSGPARPRAEDLELGDPVPVAYFGQTSLVSIDTRDDHHDLRLAPNGSSMPHLRHVPREHPPSSPT
jgi:hypothetical protein